MPKSLRLVLPALFIALAAVIASASAGPARRILKGVLFASADLVRLTLKAPLSGGVRPDAIAAGGPH